jgi:hypothetical protein
MRDAIEKQHSILTEDLHIEHEYPMRRKKI